MQLLLQRGIVRTNLGEVIARLEAYQAHLSEAISNAGDPTHWLPLLEKDARMALEALIASETNPARSEAMRQHLQNALATLGAQRQGEVTRFSMSFGSRPVWMEQFGIPGIGADEIEFSDEDFDELRRRVYDWVQNEKEWKDTPEIQADGSVMYDGPKTPENVAEKAEWILYILTGRGLKEGEMQARAALLGPAARGRGLAEALASPTSQSPEFRAWAQVVSLSWRDLFESRLPSHLRRQIGKLTRK